MSSSFLAPLVSLSGTRHGLDLLPSGKGPPGKYVSLTQSQEKPSSETPKHIYSPQHPVVHKRPYYLVLPSMHYTDLSLVSNHEGGIQHLNCPSVIDVQKTDRLDKELCSVSSKNMEL
ncbi:hypothetical protein DPMN_193304 [Dreissena polymorpha]|uniref:Uncharacterized protein n=1 Tax=Dreissena polymorpha TaxID=45954 RepID=A0A9D4BGR1_DREPO|nr:hypothetical protein DPMN_193304 [Dreissena polymorpha]